MSKLYLIPTPIGNLEDITLRSLRILNEVDLILAEDTRHTKKLLNKYSINTQLSSFHSHNEHKITKKIVNKIKEGFTYALVSDAGTPGISDPAFLLVRECITNELEVDCLPRPTAFVPALINSGIPSNQFIFEGFLPVKKGRNKRLNSLKGEKKTMIFYESPHRITWLLDEFVAIFGETRYASISREISKVFQETTRGSLKDLVLEFTKNKAKGEFVIIVHGSCEK